MEENNIRLLGYCEECGEAIPGDSKAYIDSEGNYYCSLECLIEHFGISEIEV